LRLDSTKPSHCNPSYHKPRKEESPKERSVKVKVYGEIQNRKRQEIKMWNSERHVAVSATLAVIEDAIKRNGLEKTLEDIREVNSIYSNRNEANEDVYRGMLETAKRVNIIMSLSKEVKRGDKK